MSLWLKKLNGFLMGKKRIFLNNKFKNFKNPSSKTLILSVKIEEKTLKSVRILRVIIC